MAQGDIVSWLNADDELKPRAIETAVSALVREGAGWVYGNVEIVEAEKVRILRPPVNPSRHLFHMGKGGVIPQPGTLIRRDALNLVGDLDETFELAMDFELWLRLIQSGIPSVYVDEILATFRIHPDSKTGRIGLDEFFLEEAQALEKNGRPEIAALAVGRAAAWRALKGTRASSQALYEEVNRVLRDRHLEMDHLARKRVKAAAKTEAALIETQSSPLGLRHLFSLDPWRVTETRARLVSAFAKAGRAPFQLAKRWHAR